MPLRTPAAYDGPRLDRLAERCRTRLGEETAGTLAVRSPITGDEIGHVPAASPAGVRTAADRGRAAQDDWADRPVDERVAAIEQFATLLREHREKFLDLIQLESGKTRFDAFEECLDVAQTAGHYGDRAPDYLARERHPGVLPLLTRVTEHHDPYGVAGFITPWNYPLTLAVSDAIPALLAGNAVVCKPAEQTPFTALYVGELLAEAGVPAACFEVVPGEGEVLGEPLIESVDVVSFTGSTAVGREVAAAAGRELIPSTLELGGKGPMLVRGDAPLGRTVTGAVRGGFASAGQLCIAIERIYVHESQYDAFLDRLVERVRGLDLGTDLEYGADVGSLVSEEQLQRVESHVDAAVDAGAQLLTGGRRRPEVGPLVYEPTVLTDVPADTDLALQETFGPVVTVASVPGDATALERANDTDYGLHGSVWTGDPSEGHRLARQLECGSVCVNDAYISMWGSTAAPMGGRKDSGVGRRHGREGFDRFTQSQSVAVQRGLPLTPVPGVPDRFTARGFSGFHRLVRWLGLR